VCHRRVRWWPPLPGGGGLLGRGSAESVVQEPENKNHGAWSGTVDWIMLFRRMLISWASGHFSARPTEGPVQPITCSTRLSCMLRRAPFCRFSSTHVANLRLKGASPSVSLPFKCLKHQARAHAKSSGAEAKGGPQPRLKLCSWLLIDVQCVHSTGDARQTESVRRWLTPQAPRGKLSTMLSVLSRPADPHGHHEVTGR
jgi:hypothetical protein